MFNYLVSRYTFDISILEDETGELTEQNLEKEIRNFILNTYKRDRVKVIMNESISNDQSEDQEYQIPSYEWAMLEMYAKQLELVSESMNKPEEVENEQRIS